MENKFTWHDEKPADLNPDYKVTWHDQSAHDPRLKVTRPDSTLPNPCNSFDRSTSILLRIYCWYFSGNKFECRHVSKIENWIPKIWRDIHLNTKTNLELWWNASINRDHYLALVHTPSSIYVTTYFTDYILLSCFY